MRRPSRPQAVIEAADSLSPLSNFASGISSAFANRRSIASRGSVVLFMSCHALFLATSPAIPLNSGRVVSFQAAAFPFRTVGGVQFVGGGGSSGGLFRRQIAFADKAPTTKPASGGSQHNQKETSKRKSAHSGKFG